MDNFWVGFGCSIAAMMLMLSFFGISIEAWWKHRKARKEREFRQRRYRTRRKANRQFW